MKVNEQRLNEFVVKAVNDLAAGYGGVMVGLGHKLGLYKAMAGAGPLNSQEVASRSGCAERYVREWLNSQAAGGYVLYHAASATYELTPEQAMVLASEDSPVFLPPAWEVPVSMWMDEDKALEAFRTGQGISWDQHDQRLFWDRPLSIGTVTEPIWYPNGFQPSKAWRRNSEPALASLTLVAVMVIPQSLWPRHSPNHDSGVSSIIGILSTQHKAMHRRAALPNGLGLVWRPPRAILPMDTI